MTQFDNLAGNVFYSQEHKNSMLLCVRAVLSDDYLLSLCQYSFVILVVFDMGHVPLLWPIPGHYILVWFRSRYLRGWLETWYQ